MTKEEQELIKENQILKVKNAKLKETIKKITDEAKNILLYLKIS